MDRYDLPSPLPCLPNPKKADFRSISPETLLGLYFQEFEIPFIVIDCRFPFEFRGGHFMDAKNLYTEALVEEFFLKVPSRNGNRVAIVFHCEHSSERAPHLMRHLRTLDRQIHEATYPQLYYPYVYLLDGGYKNFYIGMEGNRRHEILDPACSGYVPQFDPQHASENAVFIQQRHDHKRVQQLRRQSSWAGVLARSSDASIGGAGGCTFRAPGPLASPDAPLGPGEPLRRSETVSYPSHRAPPWHSDVNPNAKFDPMSTP